MNPQLATAIEKRSAELFTEDEWRPHIEQCERLGLCTELYDMRCHVIETVYSEQPELFEGVTWMNDDNGMPLWVRPGVTWMPDQLDDD
jgi:hypothetical protein